MNKSDFWEYIESSRRESRGDTDRQIEILLGKLSSLTAEEIVSFDTIFNEFYFLSNTWRLRAASHIINEGGSDDWFDYFRASLISQGEKVFTDATYNPESLANYISFEDGDLSTESDWVSGNEGFLYVARQAYEDVTGIDEIPSESPEQTSTIGERWEVDEVESILPELAEYCRLGRNGGI